MKKYEVAFFLIVAVLGAGLYMTIFPQGPLRLSFNFGRSSSVASTLNISSYIGGSLYDSARDITTDSAGNIYIAGGTESDNFPVTAGAYQTVHNPGQPENADIKKLDVFVTKLDPRGKVIWSTFVGGPNYDRAYAIEVDGQGYVYVAGRAGRGFPVTSSAFQTTFQGGQAASFYGPQDGFVAKLSPDGKTLLWASYFGTADPYIIRDIALDQSGNIYIGAGYSYGAYPSAVSNAFTNSPRGLDDTVIAKIANNGSRIFWASYVGGSDKESLTPSVRTDSNGNAYLLTFSRSINAPVSFNAYDKTLNGGSDFYLSKFSPAGTLLYATYIGGSQNEDLETHQLAVDGQGNAYIAAGSFSPDYPTTSGVIQRTFGSTGGTGGDVVVSKISDDGSRLLASTYYGGSVGDLGQGISINSQGNVYLTGNTNSSNLRVTADALQSTKNLGSDAFFAQMSPDLSVLIYATFLGGSGDDRGRATAIDSQDSFYGAGDGASTDWPLVNAFQQKYGGSTDGILFRLSPLSSGTSPASSPTLTYAPTPTPTSAPAPTPTLLSTAAPTNLVLNPGFESSGIYWQKTNYGGRSIAFIDGDYAQQMIVSGVYSREVYQDVSVTEGKSYQATGQIKTSGIGGSGSRISLIWLNASGLSDNPSSLNILRADTVGTQLGTQTWAKYSGTFTAPVGAKIARFRLYTSIDPDNSGTAWFDDMGLHL